MSLNETWSRDPHVEVFEGPSCRDVNKKTGRVCNLRRGHDGSHAWVWKRIDPGRVRETW